MPTPQNAHEQKNRNCRQKYKTWFPAIHEQTSQNQCTLCTITTHGGALAQKKKPLFLQNWKQVFFFWKSKESIPFVSPKQKYSDHFNLNGFAWKCHFISRTWIWNLLSSVVWGLRTRKLRGQFGCIWMQIALNMTDSTFRNHEFDLLNVTNSRKERT